MSVHASKWAWSQDCPNAAAKLVLMAFADHANADGECWPTMKRVAELAGISTRMVQRHVETLEQAGLLVRQHRRSDRGEFRGYHYQLNMSAGQERPSDTNVRRTSTSVSVGHQRPVPSDTSVRSEPSLNRQRTTNGRKPDLLFESLVEVCGLDLSELTKNERGKVNAACKQLREVGASPDDVRERARAYRRRFENAALTPTALVNNWSQIKANPSQPSARVSDACPLCDRSLSKPDHNELCEVFR
jgi:DNA-binding MarR family transcriptional regulator